MDCKFLAIEDVTSYHGAGLDRLRWDLVSDAIQNIFADTDVEILICKR